VSQGRPPSTREREAAPCGLTSSTLHCESELRFVSQLAKGIDPNASRMCAELVQLRLSIIAVRKLIYPHAPETTAEARSPIVLRVPVRLQPHSWWITCLRLTLARQLRTTTARIRTDDIVRFVHATIFWR
jgi:hypothetical protein